MSAFRPSPLANGQDADENAAGWIVRMKSGDVQENERAAFLDWLAEADANALAYKRAEAAWAIFDDPADSPTLISLRASALAAGPSPKRGFWLASAVGIAASILVALAALGPLPFMSQQTESTLASKDIGSLKEYITAKGERKILRLSDGSKITLNTDSSVSYSYTPHGRLVYLQRGQALFEVAKDPKRPFIVQASDQKITAIGTVFEVRLDTNLTKVTLIEGKVIVDDAGIIPKNRKAAIVPTIHNPGNALVTIEGAQPELVKIDLGQQLRWREGFVEFNDIPLADAVKEMNRYSQKPIQIDLSNPDEMRVSGVFRTGNNERFASIISEVLPIEQLKLEDGSIELSRRP